MHASIEPTGGPRAPRALLPVALALLALLTWMVPLREPVGFAYDDREAIAANPVVTGSLPGAEALRRDYWHHLEDAGHYRPLATLLLRLDHGRAGADDAGPYRLTNALLHGLIVLLMASAWLRIARAHDVPYPWFGIATLAVHPAGADVVAWISGRTSLVSGLGAAGGLFALSIARHGAQAMAAVAGASLVALLGKEDGVSVAASLVLFAGLVAERGDVRRRLLWAACGALLAVGAYGVLRAGALGSPLPSSPSAPLAGEALGARLTVGLRAWLHGLGELLLFWSPAPPTTPRSTLPPATNVALTIPLLMVLAWAAATRSTRPVLLVSLAAVALAVAPLSQVVPAGELFAPRFLYQPLLLGAFLVHEVATRATGWMGAARPYAMGILIFAMAAVSALQTAPRYATRLAYWESHLPSLATHARVWNAVGQARQEAGDVDGAIEAYESAIELRPRYGGPWAKAGELRAAQGDLEGAREALTRSIELDPDAVIARANLGNVLMRLERPEEAVPVYEAAILRAPGLAPLHRGLARAYLRSNRPARARRSVEEALRLDPDDASARRLQTSLNAPAQDAPPEEGNPPR